ncbi:hypothetical protein B0H12DRAFT_196266 [Mycena haematopus]|nr:hypothetical protein B0H12DRAFT_196266 [Mycena haematopus]
MFAVDTDLRRRLAEVDASISGLQYTRWSILNQLKTSSSAPGRCPIVTNFPRDITSRIFLHCLLDYGTPTPHPRYAPMLLLQVCRVWRSIALSTPGLWTKLCFHFGGLPKAVWDEGRLENFIDDCLARSGTLPLSLHLTGSNWRPLAEERARRLIPAILKRFSSRIQVLELHIGVGEYPENTPGFPLLQKLTLGGPYASSGNDIISLPISIFDAAPQLREVNMAGQDTDPSQFLIPWNNVTVFYGESLPSRECLNILRSAPSLVECSLIEPQAPGDGDIPTITHPGLKSLTLVDAFLLEFLSLPALQHLALSIVDAQNVHLLPFISASSTSLVTLKSPKVPLDSLSNMVALTDLELYDPPSEHLAGLFALLDRNTYQNVLPELQVLKLDPCSPYVNTVLVDALSSRSVVSQAGAARLRSFRQIWSPKTPGDTLRGYCQEKGFALVFEELVKKGLKIYIGHREPGACLFNYQDCEFDPSRYSLGEAWSI